MVEHEVGGQQHEIGELIALQWATGGRFADSAWNHCYLAQGRAGPDMGEQHAAVAGTTADHFARAPQQVAQLGASVHSVDGRIEALKATLKTAGVSTLPRKVDGLGYVLWRC